MEKVEEIVNYLVKDVTSKYKMESEQIREYINQYVIEERDLLSVIDDLETLDKIKKTKVFKEFKKKVNKNVYYQLKTYNRGAESDKISLESKLSETYSEERFKELVGEVIKTHVSSAERSSSWEDYFSCISKYLKSSENVLDIGCGITPIMIMKYLDEDFNGKYIAVDKDKKSIETLNKIISWRSEDKVNAYVWNLNDGWSKLYQKTGIEEYDFAMMLKFIPVVLRQERNLGDVLNIVPAKRILVSGSKESMTKKVSIEKRERSVLMRYINSQGYRVIDELEWESEFGYIIEK